MRLALFIPQQGNSLFTTAQDATSTGKRIRQIWIKLNRKKQDFYKKQSSEWREIVQVALQLNRLQTNWTDPNCFCLRQNSNLQLHAAKEINDSCQSADSITEGDGEQDDLIDYCNGEKKLCSLCVLVSLPTGLENTHTVPAHQQLSAELTWVFTEGPVGVGPSGATDHSCSSALITQKTEARMIMRITKLLWSQRTSAAPADCYSLHHQHKQSGTGESQVSHRWVTGEGFSAPRIFIKK